MAMVDANTRSGPMLMTSTVALLVVVSTSTSSTEAAAAASVVESHPLLFEDEEEPPQLFERIMYYVGSNDNNNLTGDSFGSSSSTTSTNNGTKQQQVPTFTIDILTMALIIASILYCFCLILSKRKFGLLHRIENEMTTKKLLILSVALVSLFRLMTISGVALMNIANVKAHYKLHPTTTNGDSGGATSSRHQQFYDEAMTVLFDLPNVMV